MSNTTEQHEKMMNELAAATILHEWLMSGNPSERECELQTKYPKMPRERVIRLVVQEALGY